MVNRAPQRFALPMLPEEYTRQKIQQTFFDVEQRFEQLERSATPDSSVYQMTNKTATYALDCDATSTAELADVLATLIDELARKGIITGDV